MQTQASPRLVELATRERIWRCGACGKWSHARRRPSSHVRFIPTLGMPGDAGLRVRNAVEELPPGRSCWDAVEEARALGLPVIGREEAVGGTTYDQGDPFHGEPGGPIEDWWDLGGVRVRCGPFLAYDAHLVAE